MKYRAVLFDMDGVIMDSESMHQTAFQTAMRSFGFELSEQDFINHFIGKTHVAGLEHFFAHRQQRVDIQPILKARADTFLTMAREDFVPFNGMVKIIKGLAGNVPLALVTGSSRAVVNLAISVCGLEDCFTAIVAAEDIIQSKPNPEGYLKAMNLLGMRPADCVVVEDSPSGVSAAVAAGAECVAVTNTHSAEDLTAASKVVDKLSLDLLI